MVESKSMIENPPRRDRKYEVADSALLFGFIITQVSY